ncbi:MAG: NAD(P)H-dependent oxidoreductase [Propionibacteriaceae bacterium]|nr:NAD(P)H-dependent oxidoreductase [Propionibacteriaceae bacterium]
MKVMLVIDHPYGADSWEDVPHHRSYTAALAHAAQVGLRRGGHEVDMVDLHADGFDPVMSAQDLAAWRTGSPSLDPRAADYQRRLLDADHLVMVFPVWWEAMPAATKGFVDKVVAKGVAYKQGAGLRPFTNLTALTGVTVVTTMSTPTLMYRIVYGSAVSRILLRGTFGKIGVKNLTWIPYASPERRTPEARKRGLDALENRFARVGKQGHPRTLSQRPDERDNL